MWIEFVVCPCSESFFSRSSGFPPSTKTNVPKFQLGLETVDERANLYLFIYFLFIYLFIVVEIHSGYSICLLNCKMQVLKRKTINVLVMSLDASLTKTL